MKKIITRAITGSIYVALIVVSLTLGSPVLYAVVFALFIALGIWEFNTITSSKSRHTITEKVLDIIGGLVMFFSFFWKTQLPDTGYEIIIPYLSYLVIRSIYQLYIKNTDPLSNWAFSLMGQIYIAFPISLLNIIYAEYNPHMLLAIFIFIWLNDTGAYCVGSTLGKHRLFERISPKKSWEGFWGGILFCIVSAILFYYYCNDFFNGPGLTGWILLSILVSAFSTYGDLCESLIKRTLGVKDSGKLLPGHGGILDRVDSLLLVSPIALCFLLIL